MENKAVVKVTLVHEEKILTCIVNQATSHNFTFVSNTKQYYVQLLAWHTIEKTISCVINNKPFKWTLVAHCQSQTTWYSHTHQQTITLSTYKPTDTSSSPSQQCISNQETICSPLAGKVIQVYAIKETYIKKGKPLVIIESMKMENEICSPYNAFVKNVSIAIGDMVEVDHVLVTLEKEGAEDGKKHATNE